MPAPPTRIDALIEVLAAQGVEFIVVGGVCAALQGAPIHTIDLDVVHARTPDNVARLVEVLRDLGAFYRESPGKRLRPDATDLASPGHHLLMTRVGALDLLGTIGRGRGYDDLIASSDAMNIGSHTYRVLKLDVLIRTKEEAGREKDQAMLPILRSTLEAKNRAADRRL
jgi:hypothetical protein